MNNGDICLQPEQPLKIYPRPEQHKIYMDCHQK